MSSHMSEERACETLEHAGFSESQIEALTAVFAIHPHTHSIHEIIGLEEQLEEIAEEEEDEPDSDDDE